MLIESFLEKEKFIYNECVNNKTKNKFFLTTLFSKNIYDIKIILNLYVQISTATTCAFLIAKVFLFDVSIFEILMYYLYYYLFLFNILWFQWTSANQPVFQVLLILTSFVLAWAEAWFFDFRVIPQETQARNWILSKRSLSVFLSVV